MPLTRVSLKKGKSPDQIRTILSNIYEAMRESFNVPENDYFMTVDQHDDATFYFHPTYLDIQRSDGLVIIQITANNTRGVDQKKALYKAIADRLSAHAGIRPEDVLINLVDVPKENWSFGNGLATYA